MCVFFLFLLFLRVSLCWSNVHPLVLVHGFAGWGRNEILGIHYWGGLTDLASTLTSMFSMDVFTVSLGPVSSTWDRTCELYAQLRGRRVDYGAYHSAKFNHERFGRDYTGKGLVDGWGQKDEKGMVKKVHLIAHSMGGIDVRQLTHLLYYGDLNEQSYNASDMSELFEGGKDWVLGAVTIATPHDGTTIALEASRLSSLAITLPELCASLSGEVGITDFVYDFKLDQFGLFREPGEDFVTYANRVFSSSLWTPNFEDIAMHDMVPDNVLKKNFDWKSSPNVFYMTYATSDTYRVPFVGNWLPKINMLLPLAPFATFLGSFVNNGLVNCDSAWWETDGVVNTRAMYGPTLDEAPETVTVFNGTLQRGVFTNMGKLENYDHLAIIGLGLLPIEKFYFNLVTILLSLPDTDNSTTFDVNSFSFM